MSDSIRYLNLFPFANYEAAELSLGSPHQFFWLLLLSTGEIGVPAYAFHAKTHRSTLAIALSQELASNEQ